MGRITESIMKEFGMMPIDDNFDLQARLTEDMYDEPDIDEEEEDEFDMGHPDDMDQDEEGSEQDGQTGTTGAQGDVEKPERKKFTPEEVKAYKEKLKARFNVLALDLGKGMKDGKVECMDTKTKQKWTYLPNLVKTNPKIFRAFNGIMRDAIGKIKTPNDKVAVMNVMDAKAYQKNVKMGSYIAPSVDTKIVIVHNGGKSVTTILLKDAMDINDQMA